MQTNYANLSKRIVDVVHATQENLREYARGKADMPERYQLSMKSMVSDLDAIPPLLAEINAARSGAEAEAGSLRAQLQTIVEQFKTLDRRDNFGRAIAASVLSLLSHGDAHNAQQLAQTWLDSLPERS